MIGRRAFVGSLALSCLASTSFAQTTRPGKVPCVGFLSRNARMSDGAPAAELRQAGAPPAALRQALAELGYVDGKSISYSARWAEGRKDRLRALADELVGLKVDLIVTVGGPAAQSAKEATSVIPIVILNAGDAVSTGLVASLDRPGGNITGLNDQASELSAKRLQILKEVIPGASRIAVLWNADDREMTFRYEAIAKAARALRVTIRELGVREPDDFDAAFAAMGRERPDALLLVADPLTTLNRKRILEYATAHRIPAMFELGFIVREGGLISYGPDARESWRRVAAYVDKILKGAKPAELPVEQATKFELVVNRKTAKALGVTFPQSLLMGADEVVE